jgi:HEAT repeat protein
MTTRRALIFIALIVALVIGIMLQREPHYRGRSLTSWLQQCSDTPMMETQRLAEAQAAVRAMPTREVLPRLLKLVEAEDDPVSQWIIGTGDKFRISDEFGSRLIRWHSAEDFQQLGIAGFEVLGTNAAPAVGELTRLLGDDAHAFPAVRCLIAIGIPAQAGVMKALASKNRQIRYFATQQFGWVTDDDGVYLAQMKICLKDSDGTIRFAAVQGIGLQKQAPDLAVPLLMEALTDNQDTVSSSAAKFLGEFGTNALEAFSALTNAALNGNPSTAYQSLNALVVIAPEKALPMVLQNLNSEDQRRRQAALQILCKYPATNSETLSAIKQAAGDSNPKVARYARDFLTKNYQQDHPDKLVFANEPSYEGKSLSEWLDKYDSVAGDYPKSVKDALRQIGTNGIPTLLEQLVYVRPPFGARAYDVNINAVKGLIALGESSIPALPELRIIMQGTNEDFALYAMMSACGTGSNAIPMLVNGLTNQFANVRNEAANDLTSDLGKKFPEQRKLAVPFLVKLLADPDSDVRATATNALQEIDPQAAPKAGIK